MKWWEVNTKIGNVTLRKYNHPVPLAAKQTQTKDIRSYKVHDLDAASNMPDYFRSSADREACKRKNWILMQSIDNESHVTPKMIAFALQEWLRGGAGLTTEGANNSTTGCGWNFRVVQQFVLVSTANGKEQLCLDPARLNKVFIRPVHRASTLNDILPRLAGVKCITVIGASSGIYNLTLHEASSYSATFSCSFGRYRYIWLSFEVAQVGDMLQKKIDKLLTGIN